MDTQKVIQILKQEGVGVLPTDTLYGLVASAFSKKAVKRVYQLKKRNPKKPCIILINSLNDLKLFDVKLNKKELTFLKKIWPGKASVALTEALSFRMPKPVWLRNLLKKTGPLIAPSCNPQSEAPAQTIKQAQDYFGEGVDFYLNKGKLKGKASTLVAFKNGKVVVLRQGEVRIKNYEL